MAITNSDRRDLFNQLEATLGQNAANTVMELLPDQPANQLVTRDDLHVFGTSLRSELRAEMADLRSEVRGEVSSLHGRIDKFEGHIDSAIAQVSVATQRMFMGALAANIVGVVTALIA